MKPVVLLRIAAVLMFLHFAGHTVGMLQGPSHGAAEIAVQAFMRGSQFDFMGSNRSYWDFFLGFGYAASLSMLLQTVLLWLLAGLARTDPIRSRPFIAVFVVAWVAEIPLDARYFFAAPLIFAIAMAIVLALAWVAAGRGPVVSSQRA